MWDKLSHALQPKPRQTRDESDAHSYGDVMSNVFVQHPPNLSVFHNANLSPSPPPSPSKSSRMGMFKRHTKGHDDDSLRAPSPKTPISMRLPLGLPKKFKSTFGTHANASQMSLGPSSSPGPFDMSLELEEVGQFETDVEEPTFHSKEKPPRLPSVLCDPNDSFSFWQTVFSSSAALGDDPAYPSSAKSSPTAARDSEPASRASSPGMKGRNCAFSDAVFVSTMRSSSPQSPEAGTNRKSSSDLEPDPFGAHATTYYAPQTMISATPPGTVGHASKEQDLVFSLKTQLALQMELCVQLETDLHARDELVKVLRKKLGEVEPEETKKRTVLKQWKKKVVELERACRSLEEEVKGSCQESMQRDIMDEASSESLRMLHCQISGLEREKEGWKRMEDILRKESERHREAEFEWEEQKQELLAAAEIAKLQNARLVAELDKLKKQLKDRPKELGMLKSELSAAGTDDGSASGGRILAFGKSARLNNSTKPAPRVSPAPSAPSRSATAKPTLAPTPASVHRRVASVTLDQLAVRAAKVRQATVSASPALKAEKENVDVPAPV